MTLSALPDSIARCLSEREPRCVSIVASLRVFLRAVGQESLVGGHYCSALYKLPCPNPVPIPFPYIPTSHPTGSSERNLANLLCLDEEARRRNVNLRSATTVDAGSNWIII